MEVTKLYSPNQIALGSFWGGPIAAIYFLWKNYSSIGKSELAQKALIFGVLFLVCMLALLPFLPEKFPNIIIPLLYCLTAKQIAIKTQLDKPEIASNESYSFQSSWKVFGIATLYLILFAVIGFIAFFTMDMFGVISL
ncbi:hypothetical protein [Parashewanella tropica]|uniref:hypothetical protein n=1 Tax=Parashewanella tropica TaxID=2547970 RepID=UPI00105AAE27|nr:hypothetical protein [Parashewanella tropica]